MARQKRDSFSSEVTSVVFVFIEQVNTILKHHTCVIHVYTMFKLKCTDLFLYLTGKTRNLHEMLSQKNTTYSKYSNKIWLLVKRFATSCDVTVTSLNVLRQHSTGAVCCCDATVHASIVNFHLVRWWNKKAQLTQRERATAVHVWRPTANKCKIRKKPLF